MHNGYVLIWFHKDSAQICLVSNQNMAIMFSLSDADYYDSYDLFLSIALQYLKRFRSFSKKNAGSQSYKNIQICV